MRAYSQNNTRALSKRTALFFWRVRRPKASNRKGRFWIRLRANRSSSSSAKDTKEKHFFSLITRARLATPFAVRRGSRQVSSLARGEHVDVDLALRDLSLVLFDARRERLHLVRARVLRRRLRRRRRGLLGVSGGGTENGTHRDPGDAAPGAPRHALRDHAHEPAGHAAAGLLLVRGRGGAARRTGGGRARARRCVEKGGEGRVSVAVSWAGGSPTRRGSNDGGPRVECASRAYQACVHHHRHRGDPFRSSWCVVELRGAGDCGDDAGCSTRRET